jgi:hypothetical protein
MKSAIQPSRSSPSLRPHRYAAAVLHPFWFFCCVRLCSARLAVAAEMAAEVEGRRGPGTDRQLQHRRDAYYSDGVVPHCRIRLDNAINTIGGYAASAEHAASHSRIIT